MVWLLGVPMAVFEVFNLCRCPVGIIHKVGHNRRFEGFRGFSSKGLAEGKLSDTKD